MQGAVFMPDGARVPTFVDRIELAAGVQRVERLGFREVRTWTPRFLVTRWGRSHWRLWYVQAPSTIRGSIAVAAVGNGRWPLAVVHPIRRWPNLASVEMYLRMVKP
jgi:hypothetical protein